MKIFPFFLLTLLILIPAATTATTISFSDLTPITSQKLEIHNSSGGYIGTYNSTTTGIYLDPNESYFVILVPETTNLLEHPVDLLNNIFDFVETNAAAILIAAFVLVAILAAALRR
jgi:hypothetical protein